MRSFFDKIHKRNHNIEFSHLLTTMTVLRLPILILGALVAITCGRTTYQEISIAQSAPECACQCTVPVCTPVETAPSPFTTLSPSEISFTPTVFGTAIIPAFPPSVSRAPTSSAPV